ncbi:MAG: flavin reductase family protein [Muribaculaceae bacterium]|nr:flavin reductase family protein [Muribaculaceae bacterium]
MKHFKPQAWMLPQPVLIIGTYNEDGTPNAMNAAWGGQWDYHEIMISMGNHATTHNLNRCGDFTVAFATEDTLVAADFVGIVSGRNVPDKTARASLKAVASKHVNAPVFPAFPMTLECRIKQKLDESETGYYIIAEIVNILCDEAFLAEDGKPDVEKMHLITFDPVHNGYITLGHRAGNAFHDGQALK